MLPKVIFGDLVLTPHRQLVENGEVVAIGRKALGILSALALAEGNLLTKAELMDAVWPGVTIEVNAVQVHISALRRAMGEEAKRLKTVHGLGYRLDIERYYGADGETYVSPRIAVLPFTNLGCSTYQNVLIDGLVDELITTLGQIPQLQIASHTSSFHFKNSDLELPEIARALGVNYLIEGSVRRQKNIVRIDIRLIRGKTGFESWAHSYDCSLDDIFLMQETVARSVAVELTSVFGIETMPLLTTNERNEMEVV